MDHKDFRILGLAASLRRTSFHRGIVRAAHEVAPERMSCEGFDLVLTRFSGKQVSPPEDTDSVILEAYAHEVVSFGFWPGDASVCEPAFYSYAAPEPEGLTEPPPKRSASLV